MISRIVGNGGRRKVPSVLEEAMNPGLAVQVSRRTFLQGSSSEAGGGAWEPQSESPGELCGGLLPTGQMNQLESLLDPGILELCLRSCLITRRARMSVHSPCSTVPLVAERISAWSAWLPLPSSLHKKGWLPSDPVNP